MDFESPDEIDRSYKRQGANVIQKKHSETNKEKISPQKSEEVRLIYNVYDSF